MTKLARLNAFFAAIEEAGDWRKYLNKAGTRISRQAVVEGCQFPRSTLYQATAVQMRLEDMEAELRHRGIVKSADADAPLATDLAGEEEQQIDALNARLDTLQEEIQVVQALIASFATENAAAS